MKCHIAASGTSLPWEGEARARKTRIYIHTHGIILHLLWSGFAPVGTFLLSSPISSLSLRWFWWLSNAVGGTETERGARSRKAAHRAPSATNDERRKAGRATTIIVTTSSSTAALPPPTNGIMIWWASQDQPHAWTPPETCNYLRSKPVGWAKAGGGRRIVAVIFKWLFTTRVIAVWCWNFRGRRIRWKWAITWADRHDSGNSPICFLYSL